jgi:hypothetical protein
MISLIGRETFRSESESGALATRGVADRDGSQRDVALVNAGIATRLIEEVREVAPR